MPGCDLRDLYGSRTGIFLAIYYTDYARLQYSEPNRIDAYSLSGTAHSIAVGRLSYLLNLKGPSIAVDTACSSSLVAVHLACQSLRAGESDIALAGGVSLILQPEENIPLSKWGMVSPDGRCKTFDSLANGFVRGEGCGAIVMKRLSDAIGEGDRIHAIIRGSAVNQDGRSNFLTAPNGLSQQAVIREALENAQVSPEQVSYVEAHGTGTKVGDPIEVEAVAEVVGRPRSNGELCAIGSVKTNLGHLEAASGIAGLIKVVLCMQHERIAPHLHFKELNPFINLSNTSPHDTSGGQGMAGQPGTTVCRSQFVRIRRNQCACRVGRCSPIARRSRSTSIWFAPRAMCCRYLQKLKTVYRNSPRLIIHS